MIGLLARPLRRGCVPRSISIATAQFALGQSWLQVSTPLAGRCFAANDAADAAAMKNAERMLELMTSSPQMQVR